MNNKELCKHFQTSEAVLFDIDGVIADSSLSYRRAVIETAKSYGVIVTPEMITKAKSAGSANDDWELTHRFISGEQPGVTLADVTAIFEELYQGTSTKPGLCAEEKLLGSFDFIASLAKIKKLGVVTGRPRKDAIRFLSSIGIEDFFSSIIYRESAPLKPDPTGICKALEELGCKRAWMLGDTPDDMKAAQSTNSLSIGLEVLPVGVLAPWDEPEIMSNKLRLAGAVAVLERIEELETIIGWDRDVNANC